MQADKCRLVKTKSIKVRWCRSDLLAQGYLVGDWTTQLLVAVTSQKDSSSEILEALDSSPKRSFAPVWGPNPFLQGSTWVLRAPAPSRQICLGSGQICSRVVWNRSTADWNAAWPWAMAGRYKENTYKGGDSPTSATTKHSSSQVRLRREPSRCASSSMGAPLPLLGPIMAHEFFILKVPCWLFFSSSCLLVVTSIFGGLFSLVVLCLLFSGCFLVDGKAVRTP